VNLAGAQLLGLARQNLMERGFGRFIAPSDLKLYDRHVLSVLQGREKQSCELALIRENGSALFVRLDSVQMRTNDNDPEIRTLMSDIQCSRD